MEALARRVGFGTLDSRRERTRRGGPQAQFPAKATRRRAGQLPCTPWRAHSTRCWRRSRRTRGIGAGEERFPTASASASASWGDYGKQGGERGGKKKRAEVIEVGPTTTTRRDRERRERGGGYIRRRFAITAAWRAAVDLERLVVVGLIIITREALAGVFVDFLG